MIRIYLSSVLSFLFVAAFSTRGATAECIAEGMALEACFTANRFLDAAEDACELCLDQAVLVHFQQPNCNAVTDAVCDEITECACGDNICVQEINTYVACEINDERTEIPALSSCPTQLNCGSETGTGRPISAPSITAAPPPPTPSTATATTPPAPATSTVSTTSFAIECEAESEALGSCFDSNRVTAAAEGLCESCLEAAVLGNSLTGTCADVYEGVKVGISICPCPGEICKQEIDTYAKCETEKERMEVGLISCVDEASSTTLVFLPEATAPPVSGFQANETIAPLPPSPPSTGVATYDFSSDCQTESESLGFCFESNMVTAAAEATCESCLEAVVLGHVFVSCSMIYDDVMNGITICACPSRVCQEEIDTYVKCEVEKERRQEGLSGCLGQADTIVLSSFLPATEGDGGEDNAASSSSAAPTISKNRVAMMGVTLFSFFWKVLF